MTVRHAFHTALLLLITTSLLGQNSGLPSIGKEQEAAVREAVLRYQISTWELSAATYCVAVNGKNPDEDFLVRFRPLPVKKSSACVRQRPAKLPRGFYSVVDRQTKKKAVFFTIDSVRFHGSTEAEVDGGYDCANECGGAGVYRLSFNGTDWTVNSFDIHIQS